MLTIVLMSYLMLTSEISISFFFFTLPFSLSELKETLCMFVSKESLNVHGRRNVQVMSYVLLYQNEANTAAHKSNTRPPAVDVSL